MLALRPQKDGEAAWPTRLHADEAAPHIEHGAVDQAGDEAGHNQDEITP